MAGLLSVGLIGGCVGSVDRDTFVDQVRARGGGIDADRLLDALRDIERRSDGDVLVREATVSFAAVIARVSPVERPEELDQWYVSDQGQNATPLSNLGPEDMGASFDPADLDASVIEDAIDTALLRSDLRDPWASTLRIEAVDGGGWTAGLTVTNERETETWTFGPEGDPRRQP